MSGTCGIPSDAVAVAANVTVVGPSASGYLEVHPTGGLTSETSLVNFPSGRVRSNNGILVLGVDGEISVRAGLPAGSTAHVVLDVAGYFR